MHIINYLYQSITVVSLTVLSPFVFAHNGIDHSTSSASMEQDKGSLDQLGGFKKLLDQNDSLLIQDHHFKNTHDHRKEHGAQIYAVSSLDQQWNINQAKNGTLESAVETRIGTDENKLVFKIDAEKHESHDAAYDVKLMYSRMISDFWDVQMGAQYRNETLPLTSDSTETVDSTAAVLALHGLAPYFFETDLSFYIGQDQLMGLTVETERDFLISQQLIMQPYLNLDIIFNDDSKYAKKTGLHDFSVGVETRYEITKNVMPYVQIAYQHTEAYKDAESLAENATTSDWKYGLGLRLKF